ncbi:MAG: O-antigen ligase family protein [Bacteroidales bacterium]|nr:O-antigen ligase family protein [Bacteroidales bacterium]
MISLIAFLILNAYLAIFLNRYMVQLKNPLNSTKMLNLEGIEAFLVLMMATGTLAMSSSGGGQGTGTGFNLQAIRLLLLEGFCVLGCLRSTKTTRWGIGTVAYLIYMLWLLFTMTYSHTGSYGWRYILKYLYPMLLMLCTSSIVRDEEVFVSICVWTRRIAIVSLTTYFIPFVNNLLGGMFWYSTALDMHYSTISCISLALYFLYGKDIKDLIIAIIFVLPCMVIVHRTGLLCIFGAIAVFCFYKFKWISLPYIAGVGAIGLAIVFYVPAFHDKMFWKDTNNEYTISDLRSGGISDDDIRNNGREALWEMLEIQFYKGKELTGSGIGSCQKFLYEAPATVVKQTHGDYVQIRCDTGLIGLVLWFIVLGVILVHCFIEAVNSANPEYVKYCAIIAAGSIAGSYLAMYSDNCVTYTMCTNSYSFGFYGILLGLKAKIRGEA